MKAINALTANADKDIPTIVAKDYIATIGDGVIVIWKHKIENDIGDNVLLVDVKRIASALTNIGAEKIHFRHEDRKIEIICGKRKMEIAVGVHEPDPKFRMTFWISDINAAINDFRTHGIVRLNDRQIDDLVEIIAPAMANEEMRYYLNGIHIGDRGIGMRITSTNGRALATMPVSMEAVSRVQEAIIPRGAINIIKRIRGGIAGGIEFHIGESKTAIPFNCDGKEMIILANHIKDRYPDYPRVIPDSMPWMQFSADQARAEVGVMKKTLGLTKKNRKTVVFEPVDNAIIIRCGDEEAMVKTTIDGKRLSVKPEVAGFNPFCLLDIALKLGGTITAHMQNDSSPCKFVSGERDVVVVLMPIRVK